VLHLRETSIGIPPLATPTAGSQHRRSSADGHLGLARILWQVLQSSKNDSRCSCGWRCGLLILMSKRHRAIVRGLLRWPVAPTCPRKRDAGFRKTRRGRPEVRFASSSWGPRSRLRLQDWPFPRVRDDPGVEQLQSTLRRQVWVMLESPLRPWGHASGSRW